MGISRRTFVAGLSALIAVTVCVLWARSYSGPIDHAEFGRPPRFVVMSFRGQVIFRLLPAEQIWGDSQIEGCDLLGFAAYRMRFAQASTYSLALPDWFLLALFAVPPVCRMWTLRRRRDKGRTAGTGPP